MSLATIATLLLYTATARAEVVDRLVALVEDDVITLSDVGFEEALAARDISPEAPFEVARDPLERLEAYRILRQLAGDVSLFQPAASEVDARLAALHATFPDNAAYRAFLARWGLTEESLRAQLRSRMVAEIYVHRRVGLAVLTESGPDEAQYLKRYDKWMIERAEAFQIRRVELQTEEVP